MKKLLFFLTMVIVGACNNPDKKTDNTAQSENGFIAKSVLLPSGNSGIVESGTLDTIELKTVVENKTGTYSYTTQHTDTIRHKYVVPPIIVTPPPVTTDPPATGYVRKNLTLDATFDGSNAFTGFSLSGHQYCCDYSITQVASPDGTGGKVLKYDLRSTDAIVSSSKRAEIELPTSAPEVSERWYGLRYYLQKYDSDNGAESVIQWHDQDGTTPPLSIQIQSGRMRIMQSFTSGNIPYDLGTTTIGKWINIVIHVKWTTANNGLLEVWRDSVKMVNKPNVRTNSKGGSYLKLGINKWSWAPGGGSSSTTQRIFYIDNFRMGNENATYNDVAP